MKLNNHSYVHVKIRKLCQMMEYHTGMKLITDLNQDFEQLRFISELSYLTIDYRHHICFAMSHKLTQKEQEIIEELCICLNWLEIGKRYISS